MTYFMNIFRTTFYPPPPAPAPVPGLQLGPSLSRGARGVLARIITFLLPNKEPNYKLPFVKHSRIIDQRVPSLFLASSSAKHA